jgi:uncharacterized protein (DUF433 family)
VLLAVAAVERAGQNETMRELASRITVDEKVAFGKPVIRGTRVPVALVIAKLAGGMSAAEVAQEYELEQEDVLAALSYAARLLNEEQILAIA